MQFSVQCILNRINISVFNSKNENKRTQTHRKEIKNKVEVKVQNEQTNKKCVYCSNQIMQIMHDALASIGIPIA